MLGIGRGENNNTEMTIKNKSIVKTPKCQDFSVDLEQLAATGQVSDGYLEHLAGCSSCQDAMQQRVLVNVRAQKRA